MVIHAVPGHSREVSLADCARACTQQGCDAFGYDRVYPNYCYFYRKPYVTKNRPGMTLGECTEFGAALPAQTEGATSLEPGIKLAQASGETAPVPTASDIVHCPNGPVKVTGFKLTCDWILSGGTTLGSTRLSYSVANINECAAKCRPVGACTGFTYNAGDPEGRHACTLFGGRPEGRELAGWISGSR